MLFRSSTVQLPGQLSSDQETRHLGVQFDRLFVLQSTGCHKHNIFFVVQINSEQSRTWVAFLAHSTSPMQCSFQFCVTVDLRRNSTRPLPRRLPPATLVYRGKAKLILKGGWIFDDLDIEKYVQRIESNVVSYLLCLS